MRWNRAVGGGGAGEDMWSRGRGGVRSEVEEGKGGERVGGGGEVEQ